MIDACIRPVNPNRWVRFDSLPVVASGLRIGQDGLADEWDG